MITINESAAFRLLALIHAEPDADQLGIRINVTTTGCSSYAYSIAITEPSIHEQTMMIAGIKLIFRHEEIPLLDGLMIDFTPQTGRFSIFHPHPPEASCPTK